jgi:hypothetical protein
MKQRHIANGQAEDCQLKQNGKKRQEVRETMQIIGHGGILGIQKSAITRMITILPAVDIE